MRKIDLVIIHCDDSDNPHHDDIEVIRQFHLERKEEKFLDIGYNYFIRTNGTIEVGRPLIKVPAHCEGYNTRSIGICLHGKTTFQRPQLVSCARLCLNYLDLFNLQLSAIVPHNLLDKKGKTCPNFPIKLIHDLVLEIRTSWPQNVKIS
jgi:N-acetylmuramoyl-L-alanine amidase